MNEQFKKLVESRFKELASQAGFQYDSTKDILYLEGLNPSCNEELKEFVKLIVGDCCSIVMEDKELAWADSIRISEIFKEEFGVEE